MQFHCKYSGHPGYVVSGGNAFFLWAGRRQFCCSLPKSGLSRYFSVPFRGPQSDNQQCTCGFPPQQPQFLFLPSFLRDSRGHSFSDSLCLGIWASDSPFSPTKQARPPPVQPRLGPLFLCFLLFSSRYGHCAGNCRARGEKKKNNNGRHKDHPCIV